MTKLNKITSVLLSAIMVIGIFSVIPFVAGAETKGTSGSFEYSVLDDGTASITKYIDNGSKTVDIPSTIDGYEVTKIGDGAFQVCTSLKSVTIPNSVTNIGGGAFVNCTSLVDVKLNNGLEKISQRAFKGCTSLESIEIPNTVKEIQFLAFQDCISLKSIEIPSSVNEIQDGIFACCSSLESVKFSRYSNIQEFGNAMFYKCTNLTKINLPNGLKKLEVRDMQVMLMTY